MTQNQQLPNLEEREEREEREEGRQIQEQTQYNRSTAASFLLITAHTHLHIQWETLQDHPHKGKVAIIGIRHPVLHHRQCTHLVGWVVCVDTFP